MSRTTVLALYPGDRFEDIEELHNSWGSAPVVWTELSERHLGHPVKLSDGSNEPLWKLWKHLGVPQAHRAVLMMTFDRAMVTREHYARAAADVRRFLADFPPKVGQSNHWPRIAEILEAAPGYPAIGLHCTSVSSNPFEGPYNGEHDDHDPLDWSTVLDIYADLDALDGSVEIARLRSVCRWAATNFDGHGFPFTARAMRDAANSNWPAVPREALEEK